MREEFLWPRVVEPLRRLVREPGRPERNPANDARGRDWSLARCVTPSPTAVSSVPRGAGELAERRLSRRRYPSRVSASVAVGRAGSARRKPFAQQLRILRVIAGTEYKLKYAESALGYVWSMAKPLAMFAVLYTVFGRFFKLSTGFEHYPLYLLIGLVVWNFFVDATGLAMTVARRTGVAAAQARVPVSRDPGLGRRSRRRSPSS